MTSKKAAVTAKATKAASRVKRSEVNVPAPTKAAPAKSSMMSKTPTLAKKSARQVAQPALASKQAQLIALLRSAEGATVAQMRARTGWQAHTVRGTISGVLRKRLRLVVECVAPIGEGPRVYRIVEPVTA